MIIGGLQKFSMLDYPGHLSAIIFTQGCNFNCQFCYNPMLVAWSITGKFKRKGHPFIKPAQGWSASGGEDDLFVFLKSRIGKLEAVVITGGEPTIQPGLLDFIAKIKKLGYSVKLDTNGSNPEMIKNLIDKKLIDYIAMDIKAPKEKLGQIVGLPARLYPNIVKSVKIIMESGLPPSNWAGKYEFRTTAVPGLLDKNDIIKIAKTIKGARVWYLQRFKSNVGLLNKKLQGIKPFTEAEMKEMRKAAEKYVKICEIR